MKSFKYLLMILCLSVGVYSLAEGDIAADSGGSDPNIIIFSQSHGSVSYESRKSGTIRFGVTSFFPIRRITINGKPVSGSGDSVADIRYPYRLEEGKNIFKVGVETEKGKREQQFTIYLAEKPPGAGKPFQMVGIAGISALDNVAGASDDEQSGTKLSLILVPQYDLAMSQKSTLRFRGVMLRERFSERDFSGNEISYTQVGVHWLQDVAGLGGVTAGIGMNDIRTNNDNPMLGEDESMTETFVTAGFKQKLSRDLVWQLKFDLKLRDSKEEVTSANDEADARDMGLEAGVNINAVGFKNSLKTGYRINDATGEYVDSSTVRYGIRVNYPIGSFIPGAGYDYKEKAFKNENASGVKQKDKAGTAQARVDYKWGLLPDSRLSLTWKSKNQTSNVSTSEYTASITTLALTYVF